MRSNSPGSPQSELGPLPSYAHPPLVEVIFGLTLGPSSQDLRRRFPIAQLDFGPDWSRQPGEPRPETEEFLRRWQSVLGDLWQVWTSTDVRFGWNGRAGQPYPHYETLRDGLLQSWDRMLSYLPDTERTALAIDEWHVSYVNWIPRGTVWASTDDLSFFALTPRPPEPHREFSAAAIDFRWRFAENSSAEQLSVRLSSESDEKSGPATALLLELQASGSCLKPEGDDGWIEGLDRGRRLIVSSFQRWMSPDANAYWDLRTG